MPKKKSKRRNSQPVSPVIYAADRTLGILFVLFSLFGSCLGAVGAIVGSFLSRAKTGGSSLQLIIGGVLSAVVFVVLIFAGIQIMWSSRRGFKLAIGCAIAIIVLGILNLPYGALEIVLGAVIIYCCRIRTKGKQGPPLVE